MDNRTIRNAIQKRIPEIYFIHSPVKSGNKVWWRMLANINSKIYKLMADMPLTALISHKELLNTLVSEVYDEVAKIKAGAKIPAMLPAEKDWTPFTDEEKRMLGLDNIEDAMRDNPVGFLESAIIPDVETPKEALKPKREKLKV